MTQVLLDAKVERKICTSCTPMDRKLIYHTPLDRSLQMKLLWIKRVHIALQWINSLRIVLFWIESNNNNNNKFIITKKSRRVVWRETFCPRPEIWVRLTVEGGEEKTGRSEFFPKGLSPGKYKVVGENRPVVGLLQRTHVVYHHTPSHQAASP